MIRWALFILSLTTFIFAFDLQYNPFLLSTKDSKGVQLKNHIDGLYAGKIFVQNKNCHFFVPYQNSFMEYEINACRLDYSQQKIYLEADRLNGIEIKGQIWVEGKSYRTRLLNDNWSKWKTSELMPSLTWFNKTGATFKRINGQFEFTPSYGLERTCATIDKCKQPSSPKVKQVKTGMPNEPRILIQESETGKVVIQE
ncbi:MAG: hypothetical protein HUK21_12270 [Fibrobacteraceae bacterium]|nr:hypothetical protein [Fibrobacteraceae bacterium]